MKSFIIYKDGQAIGTKEAPTEGSAIVAFIVQDLKEPLTRLVNPYYMEKFTAIEETTIEYKFTEGFAIKQDPELILMN